MLDLVKQPYVLNCDYCLVREGGGQVYLSGGEWSHDPAHQHGDANRNSFAQQGNTEHGTNACFPRDIAQGMFRVVQHVRDVDDAALERSSPSDRAAARCEPGLCHVVMKVWRVSMACRVLVVRADQAMDCRH